MASGNDIDPSPFYHLGTGIPLTHDLLLVDVVSCSCGNSGGGRWSQRRHCGTRALVRGNNLWWRQSLLLLLTLVWLHGGLVVFGIGGLIFIHIKIDYVIDKKHII
jgi:hypothetical protein